MRTSAVSPSSSLASMSGLAEAESLSTLETSPGPLARLWRWVRSYQIGGSSTRRLQVAETVSLGEKRFVAVVQVDGRHFLLAGGPANIALLAQLNEKEDFEDVLKKTMTVAPPAPVATVQQREKAPRKRASRPKKKAIPIAAAPPKRTKAVAKAKKVTSAVMKKPAALAAKKTSKPASPKGRFGDIPSAPSSGVRAFEAWLGRAVPVETARAIATKPSAPQKKEPAPEKVAQPAPSPLPPKQTLNEWLQETRTLPEKPATVQPIQPMQPISEPVTQPKIEEYA